MPWTPKDADTHVKGLSAKQRRAWADVANSALESCLKDSGSQAECEASAIKQANSAAQQTSESLGPPHSSVADGDAAASPVSVVFSEAATLKKRAQSLLRDLDALLADKGLAGNISEQLQGLRAALKQKWTDLADPAPDAEPATEAARLWTEATAMLRQDDSLDAQRMALCQALMRWAMQQPPDADADPMDAYGMAMPCVRDVFADAVVFDWDGQCYRADYTIGADDSVTLSDPAPVELAYVPMGEAMAAGDTPSTQNDPNVGGGVDRKKIPAADFAGKNRSFPIVTPGDVADAAASIGRAGADNYSTDELKANIIRIAQRKGAAFVAQLPQAWRDEMDKAKEAAEPLDLTGDLVPLVERAVRPDGTVRLKLIAPGQGSSGFYPAETLKRDGPRVFKKNLQCYWDHQTAEEAAARPEGSLRDLAAVLASDAEWQEHGPAGPGLYADAKVFQPYAPYVEELAPHIGMSIRAFGRAKEAAKGGSGPVIDELVAAKSVDFVTVPGAGGQVLSLFEAARGGRPSRGAIPTEEEHSMSDETRTLTEAEAKNLREAMAAVEAERDAALAESKQLRHDLQMREAVGAVREQLARYQLHALSQEKLASELLPRVPFQGDKVDTTALEQMVKEAVKAEVQYIAETSGVGLGQIRGLGAPLHDAAEQQGIQASQERAFSRLLDPDRAKTAAAGRR